MTTQDNRIPSISVIMPVYNGERFLSEAIESILNQSFTDFELIIVDDASTDRTPEILSHYQQSDSRLHAVRQQVNQGVTAALNRACALAQGCFIARMDADDVSMPDRFERQLTFMEQHPQVGVLGSWIQCIDQEGRPKQIVRYPVKSGQIKWALLFYSPFAHPTVIMRRDVLKQVCFYNPKIVRSQDYDLWLRLSRLTRMANLPRVLCMYREWNQSITGQHLSRQKAITQQLAQKTISDLLKRQVPGDYVESLQGLSAERYPFEPEQIRGTAQLIQDLLQVCPAAFQLTSQDIRDIQLLGATKLWLLGALALRKSPLTALSLMHSATRLHPLSALYFFGKVLGKVGR
ncbi:MAG: glycosyltransferase [Anaerolineae bacterium]|nr:glycosyltransferase [Anaerolineae bacterium]